MSQMLYARDAYAEALIELGKKNKNIVVLDADLASSTRTGRFAEKFPERFFNCGVAEQNMMGIPAGLALTGWLPFVSTFAVFAAKRAVDQVRVSIAYPDLDVKINGAYAGIPTGKAGATHQSVEDIAVMRCMPHMTVVCPGDPYETQQAVYALTDFVGPVYLRTVRCPVPVIFDNKHKFEIGRSYTLCEGNDVTIIATGMMTPKALTAALELEKDGITARMIHLPTIKPMDEAALVKSSKETGRIITVENQDRKSVV